jgi:hypothetical protein
LYDVNNILEHYGIPGMHWGRRKNRSNKPRKLSRREIIEKESSEDATRKRQLRKKKLHELTNEELKTLNTRMQLEKQYRELTKTDVSSGRRFVADVLTNTSKQTANTYTSRYLSKGVELALKTVIS